jgi:hypothetical protein
MRFEMPRYGDGLHLTISELEICTNMKKIFNREA